LFSVIGIPIIMMIMMIITW